MASSGVPPGTEKSPAELNLKSWHIFVVRVSIAMLAIVCSLLHRHGEGNGEYSLVDDQSLVRKEHI